MELSAENLIKYILLVILSPGAPVQAGAQAQAGGCTQWRQRGHHWPQEIQNADKSTNQHARLWMVAVGVGTPWATPPCAAPPHLADAERGRFLKSPCYKLDAPHGPRWPLRRRRATFFPTWT